LHFLLHSRFFALDNARSRVRGIEKYNNSVRFTHEDIRLTVTRLCIMAFLSWRTKDLFAIFELRGA
jgi:hypothetical protein